MLKTPTGAKRPADGISKGVVLAAESAIQQRHKLVG